MSSIVFNGRCSTSTLRWKLSMKVEWPRALLSSKRMLNGIPFSKQYFCTSGIKWWKNQSWKWAMNFRLWGYPSTQWEKRHLARNKMFFGWHLQNMTASSQMLCKACSELFLPRCAAYTRFWVRRNPNVAPIKLITFQTQTRWLLFVVVQMLSRVWLCDPTDCSPKGSSVHGISQARILEWVAIFFSMGSSQPRNWTCFSCIGRGATREGPIGMEKMSHPKSWYRWVILHNNNNNNKKTMQMWLNKGS